MQQGSQSETAVKYYQRNEINVVDDQMDLECFGHIAVVRAINCPLLTIYT